MAEEKFLVRHVNVILKLKSHRNFETRCENDGNGALSKHSATSTVVAPCWLLERLQL